MPSRWLLLLATVLVVPTIAATPPSPPLDLTMRIDDAPTLHQRFAVTVIISAHIPMGNVTVDLDVPDGWTQDPAGNRTLNLREKEQRSLSWHVTPKSEGFWIVRAHLAAYEGGMTSWTEHYGFLHGGESLISTNPANVIPTPSVDLQFRAIEQTPANVTLIATVTPRASWMRFGTLTTEFGILNESKHAEGPGNRALIASLTTFIPPYHGARGWSQFGFTPDWRTAAPPDTGRYGIGLGCRDLWVTREAAPALEIEASRGCEEVRSHLAPGPGIAALVLLGITAAWTRRRPT